MHNTLGVTSDVPNIISQEDNREISVEDRVEVNDETNPEEVKEQLEEALKVLSEKLMARVDGDPGGYAKAVTAFGKTVAKLPNRSDAALQKSLFSFGKSVTQACFYI